MDTNKCVKWSKEASSFFETAADNSLTLEVVISQGCLSQTGEGFEELVNSLNSPNIKKKIKKINVTDTAYLYRHYLYDFAKYSNETIPTPWFLNNQASLSKLEIEHEYKLWHKGLETDDFKFWQKEIYKIYEGDENGNGNIQEFRELIIADATIASNKGNGTFQQSIDFLLEESAYACAYLQNSNLVYPIIFTPSFLYLIEKYANIRQLNYKISKNAQSGYIKYAVSEELVDREIIDFMKSTVSNVNFFVIDKNANYLCRNKEFAKIAENIKAYELDQKSWESCKKVMKSGKQIIVEEEFNGTHYLSVKAPLIINDTVKGVIGLAVDRTDSKKAEQLQINNEIQKLKITAQEEFNKFTSQMAHDIRSPLATLGMIAEACNNIPEKEHIALRSVIGTIRDIADNLLHKYKEHENECNALEQNTSQKMLVNLALSEIIGHKRYQYKDTNVKFNYHSDQASSFVFIKCNYFRFSCMISNLINNSVEALPNSEGIVDVCLWIENHNIKISIKDNGKGMPKEFISKILDNIPVESTKEGGYGIGLRNTMNTLHLFDGKIGIESKENAGTTIILTFPVAQSPEWILKELELKSGSTVVVLDDDASVHHIWSKALEKYDAELEIKYFEYGKDAINFINSSKEKDRILLLTDFELRNQELNGADVINRTDTHNQSIIVTSISNDKTILDFSEQTGVKILPKSFINQIPTTIIRYNDLAPADMIILDDYEPFAELLADFFKTKGKKVDTYYNSAGLLNTIVNYPKDTKIVMDNELKEQMTGIELAKKLKDAGFSELYLLSGKQFDRNEVPNYLRTILKDDYNYLEKLYTTIF